MNLRYYWEPGNGTRYDLVFGKVGDNNILSWMRLGGSGGKTIVWDGFLHHTYIQEKMDLNEADAHGILSFLEIQGLEVGLPQGEHFEQSHNTPRLYNVTGGLTQQLSLV